MAQEPTARVALDVTLPGTAAPQSNDPSELSRGDIVGRFVILSELGRGGMGVVYSAYDPELERKVAIKTISSPGEGEGEGEMHLRTLHEAKALARLSHANVVGVHDVGVWCDRVWLAMEFVEGHTLQEWLRAGRRSWRDIVRVLAAAGEGLKAAHGSGLVHGDFKPDNIMIDTSDRVRVMDFGLAHGSEGLGALSMVSSGELVQGTPAYMAPEQWRGGATDARSDQFSFSVTLYEALYGVRPFAGDTWSSVWAKVERGVVPLPPPNSRVPGRLFKVVARGLATEPQRRWPNMEEMLVALTSDPGRARVRLGLVVGTLGVLAAGSVAFATMGKTFGDRCNAASNQSGAMWTDERRTEVRRAFIQTGLPFAADVLDRVDERLDRYSTSWQAAHVTACRSHAAGSITSRMLDLSNACLARHKQHVLSLMDILAGADREVVENAVQAVAALPSIKVCEDGDELLNAVPPADDPETAGRVEKLREWLARARMLEAAGSYAEGVALASKVRNEGELLRYAPLQAEAALVEGTLLSASGRPAEAEVALTEALGLALKLDLRAVAAEAAVKRIFVLGDGLTQYAAALTSGPVAAALVERAHDEGALSALLENNLGIVFDRAGDDAAAERHLKKAVEMLLRLDTADPLLAVAYHNLANVALEQSDLDAAQQYSMQAYELLVRLLGDGHPMVGHPLSGLGDVALRREALDEASEKYSSALTLLETAHGPMHPYIVGPLSGLAHVAVRRGDTRLARQRFERAVMVSESNSYVHPAAAEAFAGLGELVATEGDYRRALQLFGRAVRAYGDDRTLGRAAALRAEEMAAKLGDTPEPARMVPEDR